jgi:polyphosphate kinase
VVNLFHFLTGYAPGQRYRRAMVAPEQMRTRFEALIDAEIEHQRQTGDGRIIAKMNGLDDVRMVRRLYQASQAGVQIDLIIRGHCTLRPGLPGFSDNIRVISILGRFLEHDRIFYFHNNGKPRTYHGQRGLADAQPHAARRAGPRRSPSRRCSSSSSTSCTRR